MNWTVGRDYLNFGMSSTDHCGEICRCIYTNQSASL